MLVCQYQYIDVEDERGLWILISDDGDLPCPAVGRQTPPTDDHHVQGLSSPRGCSVTAGCVRPVDGKVRGDNFPMETVLVATMSAPRA